MDLQAGPAYLQVMDWGDLPFFLATARAGQIGRAATQLRVDATTVGRRIRRLERSLGQRLFEQEATGQRLTPAGQHLLERVEAMDELTTNLELDARAEATVRGTVRVSTSEGLGTWFVARHLSGLRDLHPAMEIDLVSGSGFLSPTRRETDVAILLARPRRGPLVTRKLTDYGLRLYGARDYLANHAPVAQAGDLSDHTIVGYVPDILYTSELAYADAIPEAPTPTLRSSSINAQHAMIAAGAGLGILPCFIGDSDPTLQRVLPDFRIARAFWIVTHESVRPLRHVSAFVDWMVDLAASHRPFLLGE